MMRRLTLWTFTALVAIAAGALTRALFAQQVALDAACRTLTLRQTDSLRSETYRKSSTGATLAPRATVVRRLATRIDSLQAACVVPPRDSTPPRDSIVPPSDTIVPPRDTTPPTPVPVPVPLGRVVQIDPSQRFQVMQGWRSGGYNYDNCPAYPRYRDALIQRLVTDYNLTHRSLQLQTGTERPDDYTADYATGRIDQATWRTRWFWPINDNADPRVADPAGFHWTALDAMVDAEIAPWRTAVVAAGKRPYVTLLVVDFKTTTHGNLARPLDLLKNPEEYAELVSEAFAHLQTRYGWVPDALELTLEPENSQTYAPDLARALLAAKTRLAARGWRPAFAAPSNSTARNAAAYVQQMQALGATPDWVVWHRYIAPRPDAAVLAGLKALPGLKGMTEYNETTSASDAADLLFEDLTQADVSTWVLFLAAACGKQDNPENKGAILQVNITDSLAPKINATYRGVLLREVYAAVNAGDRRIGAAVGDTTARAAAFLRPDGRVVVTLRARVGGTFTIKGLPAGTYTASYALAQSLARVTLPVITTADAGDLQVTIPGNGVLSLVPSGSAPPPPPPPPPPVDTTPPPVDTTPPPPPPADTSVVPLPPTPSGITNPELPRTLPAYPLALHARPCTDRPTTIAALRAALSGPNKTVCLQPGALFVGSIDIPARPAGDTSWSVLRTEASWTLGVRVHDLSPVAEIELPSDARFPGLWFHAGSARWLVQGVRIRTHVMDAGQRLALVEVGERAGNTLSNLPRDIHFAHVDAHCYLMQDCKVGLYLNGVGQTVRDSRVTEVHYRNADSQALLTITSPGPFLYENNHLEAASENIMFGGGDPLPGVVPCDATIRGNTIRKPIAWKAIGTPTQSGSYLVKLLIEAKNACRVLVEGNRLDGSWLDGQTGYAITLKSVNQEGGCRWCRTTDWTIRHNTIVNVGGVFTVAGRPEVHPVDTAVSRVLVTGNWIDSVNIAPYNGDARAVLLSSEARDIQFVRNTWASGNFSREVVVLGLAQDSTGKLIQPIRPAVTGFRFDENVLPIGTYGVGATATGEGSRALAAPVVTGTMSFQRNAFVGGTRNGYPTSTTWHPSLAAALAAGAGQPSRPVP